MQVLGARTDISDVAHHETDIYEPKLTTFAAPRALGASMGALLYGVDEAARLSGACAGW